jgi:hypothetical protein
MWRSCLPRFLFTYPAWHPMAPNVPATCEPARVFQGGLQRALAAGLRYWFSANRMTGTADKLPVRRRGSSPIRKNTLTRVSLSRAHPRSPESVLQVSDQQADSPERLFALHLAIAGDSQCPSECASLE